MAIYRHAYGNTEHICKHCGNTYPVTADHWRTDNDNLSGLDTGKCINCYEQDRRDRYHRDPEAAKQANAAYRVKVRLEILAHYSYRSDGVPECACCGEYREPFLVLDHIAGGGNKHRKSERINAGYQTYLRLRKQGYPGGFRVLCQNCNAALGNYGKCPHEDERCSENSNASI